MRQKLRYHLEEDYIIELLKNSERYFGLVRDESKTGICAIFRKPFEFSVNDELDVVVHETLGDLKVKIIWLEEFDTVFFKVGMEIV